jgi:hypothetical protein
MTRKGVDTLNMKTEERNQKLSSISHNWMSEAKCREEHKTTSHFFEDFERASGNVKAQMVRFCESCPVINDCFSHAEAVGETGLWGGVYFLNGRPKNPLKARYLEPQRDEAATKKAG